jgi:hypothetical protein
VTVAHYVPAGTAEIADLRGAGIPSHRDGGILHGFCSNAGGIVAGLAAIAAGRYAGAASDLTAQGTSPSCLRISVGTDAGFPEAARVMRRNTRSTNLRLEVIWTSAHDTDCFTLRAGATRAETSAITLPFSHYDKTVTC